MNYPFRRTLSGLFFHSIYGILLLLLPIIPVAAQETAQIDQTYRMPPEEIAALIDAPPIPMVKIGPSQEWIVILERPGLPPLEEYVQPELRLAGLRINPQTNGYGRSGYYTDLKVGKISDPEGKSLKGLPEKIKLGSISWSPDGEKIAFTNTTNDGIELWAADVNSARAERLGLFYLNDIYGAPFYWHPGSELLICKTILSDRGEAPEEDAVPTGPVIQESGGDASPAPTYADLLKNSRDEDLLEYYLGSQLAVVNLKGEAKNIGKSGIIVRADPAPGGEYILVETIHRPFSYLVPVWRFPRLVEIWNLDGKVVRTIHDQPLAENIPNVSDGVRTGPRHFDWRSDVEATVFWTEALDEGDPRIETEVREQLYTMKAPFRGNPIPFYTLNMRFYGITWCNDDLALISESWWKTRKIRTWAFAPGSARVEPELVFDYSREDRYNHPGYPVTTPNAAGHYVLQLDKKGTKMYLTGKGASPEGDRPFLDQYDFVSKEKVRLWRSEPPYYESVVRIIDPDEPEVLTSRETNIDPANLFYRNLKKDKLEQITYFTNPTPEIEGLRKEQIKYERADGLALNGVLYLPPGYNPDDGPLPTLVWAYPWEYKSADAAGQMSGSAHRFTRVAWYSPSIWAIRGYAVLDKAAMPIVGEGDDEPNDSFIEQLTANAQAAVDELVRRGVTDPDKIAVGGHSYGAFMAANLLAHTDLFRAGLARSGAYNRTLTPFGFQHEDRTYWEAPDIYNAMSPFMHVDEIDEPILLVHGEADNNSGTYPMQSRRFFNALKGHGATARLVMLPYESHSYRARESVMHVLYETNRWLEKYVKNAPPREADAAMSQGD